MDIAVKKLELLDWIMHLEDTAMFKKLLEMKESAKEYTNDNNIVGHTVLGEPLNIEQYNAKIDKGIKDIEEGRYTSQDNLLNEIENW